jgi:GT2 family glycosyltransferase
MPSWWQESFNELCGELDYGPRRVRVGYPRYPYAGNLSFRRCIFEKAGYFSPELGPVGQRHLDGEEFEQCLRIERTGGMIFFDPALKVYHRVSQDRLSRRFVFHKAFSHGRTMALIEASHFGRWFAMWRNVQVQRNLVKRRSTAFRRLKTPGVVPEIEGWLADTARRLQRPLDVRVVAQGLGYSYQMFAHELWRRRASIMSLEEAAHDGV